MKKKETKTFQGKSGYWYRAAQFETCCDCGLTHQRDWKVRVNSKVLTKILDKHRDEIKLFFRYWRDKEKTTENRKKLLKRKNGAK
jgi:hypothetical protein